jgi:DNA repair protein RecO (recombination protein O)
MRGAPTREAAIVLRNLRLGESSKIVSVLTPDFGRVKVVAKGARQLRSRWASVLEPGNEVELMIYARPGRDLWMLGDAQLGRAVLTAGQGLNKLSLLFAALELCERLLPEQEPVADCERSLRSYLDRWHRSDDASLMASFFTLELELARSMGIAIDLESCGECGAQLVGRVQHRASEGFLRCAHCHETGSRWLDAASIATLRRIDRGDAASGALASTARKEIGRLLHEHLAYHLPNYRLPRSLYWLEGEATG